MYHAAIIQEVNLPAEQNFRGRKASIPSTGTFAFLIDILLRRKERGYGTD
jgi:hypothetical protein